MGENPGIDPGVIVSLILYSNPVDLRVSAKPNAQRHEFVNFLISLCSGSQAIPSTNFKEKCQFRHKFRPMTRIHHKSDINQNEKNKVSSTLLSLRLDAQPTVTY